MATINPNQGYDIIHTLTYASSGGTGNIRLHRGSSSAFTGTVYYRAGTSGAWTSLSVSGVDTTFPITSTTMQIAHDWNKSGNDYMTPRFQDGTMTGIAISQKAVLSGVVGSYFMQYYAVYCSDLTTLDVPDTSGVTSVGDWFMSSYAMYCYSLTTLAIPDTSELTSIGAPFMSGYAYNCSSLTKLILPKAGWFKTNNAAWGVPSERLGLLHGDTTNPVDQADWQALTVSGKALHTNYIRNSSDVSLNFDVIHTLTYASSGGTNPIQLYRGSTSAFTGTVYYRAGTSGTWTQLSVSGTSTTFPITSTTMQIAHNWNKSGDNYMTPGFENGTMTGIAISQKAVLSGVMGDYFMFAYAWGCTNLTTLAIPDTSGLTSAGSNFMQAYANGCFSLTTLDVPDTSGLTSVGNKFMFAYADGCSSLTTLAAPDTSGLTSVGDYFMSSYANGCSSLTTLAAPDTSGLTSVGNSFMDSYAYGCINLTTLAIPDTSGLTSVGSLFMSYYAYYCTSLTKLILPKAGWFKTNNVNWRVPSGRLGLLHGDTTNSIDQADWQALTVSGKTLHTNYIREAGDVWLNGEPPSQSPSGNFLIFFGGL